MNMYTIKFATKPRNTAGAIVNKELVIDGDTDITDVADALCNDSTPTIHDDLLQSLTKRGLPTTGTYLVSVYNKIKSRQPAPVTKERVNIYIDAGLRDWAESQAGDRHLSGYLEALIQAQKNIVDNVK